MSTPASGSSDASTDDTAFALWEQWTQLWNGKLSVADRILADNMTVHAALAGDGDDSAIQGAQGVVGWINQLRAVLGDPVFTVQVGPLVDGPLIAGRWQVSGHYAGGMPGATAAVGTPVSFTGTDLLRVASDRLAEYWVNSDVHVMSAQLGIGAS
ncbi:MAG TPA: ester cyclase [Pseudonocardiaceae bacterium]